MKKKINFIIYATDIQVLTKLQLKMPMIGEDIAKNVILPQILPIFRPSLVQIVSKIAKFERISIFFYLNHGNTHTDRVSSQNDNNW